MDISLDRPEKDRTLSLKFLIRLRKTTIPESESRPYPIKMNSMLLIATIAAFASVAHGYTGDALKDQVTSLPGLTDEINFNQFSGYLTVGNTKNMHYWMVEVRYH